MTVILYTEMEVWSRTLYVKLEFILYPKGKVKLECFDAIMKEIISRLLETYNIVDVRVWSSIYS